MPKKRLPKSTERSVELPVKRGRKRAAIDDINQQGNDLDPTSVKHSKIDLTNNEDSHEDSKSRVNIYHLNSDVWKSIFLYLSDGDVLNLSATSEHFQQIVRETKSEFNLSKNYRLDVNYFLNYILSKTCTSIDINYCKWLTPNTIIEMISKTNLRHLHLIQCELNEDCVRSICSLQLRSLSFTYTDEWRSYFSKNIQHTRPCFQSLTKLVIETSHLLSIYTNVLQHCNELQHLKLFKDGAGSNPSFYAGTPEPSKFPSQSTALLKLTSLEVDINDVNCEMDVCSLLKAILKAKVIPLNNVDFGINTCCLLKDGILNHPLILPNKSKFILRGYPAVDSDQIFFCSGHQNYEDYDDQLSYWMNRTPYETVFLQNVEFKNWDFGNLFEPFANQIESAAGKSIKRVYIRDCLINDNFSIGIGILAVRCPQITVLHLQDRVYNNESYDEMLGNKSIFDDLMHLKNLKELVLSPSYLHCNYRTEDNSEKCLTIMPFWKVTQSCEQLIEIRLKAHARAFDKPTIHADSIKAIAHCKALRVLELSDFEIVESKIHPLSDIAKNSSKLEQLFIGRIEVGKRRSDYIIGNFLNYTKDLKILNISISKSFLTDTFLNGLGTCEKLENITFELFGYGDLLERDVGKLMKVLPKLKNLFVAYIWFCGRYPLIRSQLRSLFENFKKERPAFCSSA